MGGTHEVRLKKKKEVQGVKSISMRVGGMDRGKQDLGYSISRQNSMNKSPLNRLRAF